VPVRRVSVVGVSGSGKTTLARLLADRLEVPMLELDSVFHQPGWAPLPVEQFHQRVNAFVTASEGWVVDGNYQSKGVQEVVWRYADTVLWLDPSRSRVMRHVIGRTLRRVITREELWNGNRESLRDVCSLDPQRSVIAWAWTRYHSTRRHYADAAAAPPAPGLTFHRVTSRSQLPALLDSCAAERLN
jgi:adenylate kinase family enzyme